MEGKKKMKNKAKVLAPKQLSRVWGISREINGISYHLQEAARDGGIYSAITNSDQKELQKLIEELKKIIG